MHPILFSLPFLGHFKIHTFSLLVALGFLVGMLIVNYEAKRLGENVQKISDLSFYVILSSIIGSRLYYVLIEEKGNFDSWLDLFKVWEGGLTFLGGVFGALIASWFYVRKHQLSYTKLADIYFTATPLGHFFGRWACFFAGCCYGRTAPNFPFAITFPQIPEGIAPPGIPLYPTQLMEAFGELGIFFILWFYRKKKAFDGSVALYYLILYSSLRIVVEIFRGDDDSRYFIVYPYLSSAQFLGFILILLSIIIYFLKIKSQKKI